MIALEQELNETIRVWPMASKIVSTIRTKTDYHKMVNLLDVLIDSVSEMSDPVKESLIDILGTLKGVKTEFFQPARTFPKALFC